MARTYAVVEFESTRECAVVPVLWIVQNETYCYWPQTKTEEAFHKLVEDFAPYQKSWRLFPLRRVLFTSDDLQTAEHQLTDAIDNGTSEEGTGDIVLVTRKSKIDNDNFISQGRSAMPLHENQNNNNNIEKNDLPEDGLLGSQKHKCYSRKNTSSTETISVVRKTVINKENSTSSEQSPSPPPSKYRKRNKNRRNSVTTEKSSPAVGDKRNHSQREANSSLEEVSPPLPKRKKKHHKIRHNSFSEDDSSPSTKKKRKNHKKNCNNKKKSKREKNKNRSESNKSVSTSSLMDVSEPETGHIVSHKPGTRVQSGSSNKGRSTPTQASSAIRQSTSYRHGDISVNSGAQYERSITGMTSTPKSTIVNERINSHITTPTISRASLNSNREHTNGSPVTPRLQFVPLPDSVFQERVIRYFEHSTVEHEAINNTLSQILRFVQASSNPTSKPDNIPDLPLKDILSFEDLDTQLLQNEALSTYLINRLAAIGGLTQRQSVMSMMRFLFSNELAMRFNWAGQNQKRSFKQTTVKEVIFEAAKIMFKGKHSSDKIITSAIQDWLKLAKNRHDYKTASRTAP